MNGSSSFSFLHWPLNQHRPKMSTGPPLFPFALNLRPIDSSKARSRSVSSVRPRLWMLLLLRSQLSVFAWTQYQLFLTLLLNWQLSASPEQGVVMNGSSSFSFLHWPLNQHRPKMSTGPALFPFALNLRPIDSSKARSRSVSSVRPRLWMLLLIRSQLSVFAWTQYQLFLTFLLN